MNSYRYRKTDAFTSTISLGNPAASVYLTKEQSLTDEQMQSIAKQHKGFVCEMVFCKECNDCYELAYFSSECEVQFCGHGTIACMHSLIKNTPELLDKKEIIIKTRRKGNLTIYNEIAEQDAIYISAPEALYLDTELSVNDICEAMNLSETDISVDYPIDFIDAGNRTLIVPINSLEKEIAIFPDEEQLRYFTFKNGIDVILIFCMDTKEKGYHAHTRVFAPKFGYLEDPATGSANSSFAYYMLKNKMWNGEMITLEQGGNDRIFNPVKLVMKNGNLLFGGSATTRIEGEYFI